jgi:hypothetical protein
VVSWRSARRAAGGPPRQSPPLTPGQRRREVPDAATRAAQKRLILQRHFVITRCGGHRWTILALLAHAFLSVLAAAQPDTGRPYDGPLIPLTRNEIRRLFTGLGQQPPAPAIQLHWSRWRRRHQATARRCHYQPHQTLTA